MEESLENLLNCRKEAEAALLLSDKGLLETEKITDIENKLRNSLQEALKYINNEELFLTFKKMTSGWTNVLKPGFHNREVAEKRFSKYINLINEIVHYKQNEAGLVVEKEINKSVPSGELSNIESKDNKNEALGSNGFGDNSSIDPIQIDLCKEWIIKWATKQKNINEKKGSYSLKHLVEDDSNKYISNGAFIKAGIDLGYKYKIEGKNAYFNMSFIKLNNIKTGENKKKYFQTKYTKEGYIKRGGDFIEPAIGVSDLANEISKIIIKMNDSKGAVFGVFGKWGRGKTFLINQIKKESDIIKEFEFIDFHAWKYQDCLSSQAYLYQQIINSYLDSPVSFCFKKNGKYQKTISKKSNFIAKFIRVIRLNQTRFFSLLAVFIVISVLIKNNFSDYSWSSFAAGLTFFLPFLDILIKATTSNVGYFSRKKISDLLGSQAEIEKEIKKLLKIWPLCNKRLLLIVDDLDRCSEEKIIEIIDSLRIMLEDKIIHKKINVLLAADERILERAIKYKYTRFFKDDNNGFRIDELISEYMDKLFLCGIRLGNLTDTEKKDMVYAFTKKMIVEDDKIGNDFFNEDKVSVSNKNNNPDIEEKETFVIKKVNQDQITIEEGENILDAVGEIDRITPRQIDIFIFRYLFARNILNKKSIPFDSSKVCSVMAEYMNSESGVINEGRIVDDSVEAVLEMVITY